MNLSALMQLAAACIGIVGSMFFAIGVIRQTTETMARLSYTYWDSNPDMPAALVAQKADYIFGGGFIVLAFFLQFVSFFSTSPELVLSGSSAAFAPWAGVAGTFILFLLTRIGSTRLASYFRAQVEELMRKQNEEYERKRIEEREAKKNAI